jgi:PCFT/HCP family folate transporter-like MFS transporter 1/3
VIIRSQCTKSVDPDETGRIFAMVALGQALVPLVANPLYALVYKASMDTFPGAYLIIVDVLLAFAFCSSVYLYWENRRLSRRQQQEQQQEQQQQQQQQDPSSSEELSP